MKLPDLAAEIIVAKGSNVLTLIAHVLDCPHSINVQVPANIRARMADWIGRRGYDVMLEALIGKFKQDDLARAVLMSTKNSLIVYAGSRDAVFGVQLEAAEFARATYQSLKKVGQLITESRDQMSDMGGNALGLLLTQVGEYYRQ